MPRPLLVVAVLFLAAAGPAPAPAPNPVPAPPPRAVTVPAPVPLAAQPRTWMDTAARRLLARDLAEARQAGEVPLVLVGSARLGAAPGERAALFVQLQSPRECGSAGCSTQVFVWRAGQWSRVLDGVSGKLGVAGSRTKGMADLVSDNGRYVWTGTAYRDTRPAPAVDLRPRG